MKDTLTVKLLSKLKPEYLPALIMASEGDQVAVRLWLACNPHYLRDLAVVLGVCSIEAAVGTFDNETISVIAELDEMLALEVICEVEERIRDLAEVFHLEDEYATA